MHTVAVTSSIRAPFETVWALLDDFGQASVYGPGIEASRIINDIPRGLGAMRECVLDDGGIVQERITAYQPRQGFTVEMIDFGKIPLKKNTVQVAAKTEGPHQTQVSFQVAFWPKFGPLGWLLAQLMIKKQLAQTFHTLIGNLETVAQERVMAQ